ncbi:MAG TPA: hypothetical protein VMD30_12535 [Tepidisphaeraceae bacterium]|nr:hypothetical protein [Tepidisphaeraceae bacterium]
MTAQPEARSTGPAHTDSQQRPAEGSSAAVALGNHEDQTTAPTPSDGDDGGDWNDNGDDDGGNNDDSGGGDGRQFRWVTIAAFSSEPMAQIARLRLESEEIPCLLLNVNTVAIDWLLSNATGGIQLQVPDCDVARAAEILRQKAPRKPESDDDADLPCPACGSTRSEPAYRMWAFLSLLLLGAPIPIFTRRRRCRDCGRTFDHRRGFPVSPPEKNESS